MQKNQKIHTRPLDPTTDAEDIIGDTTGKTGMTTNALNDRGNAPMGSQIDKTHLPGGVIQTPKTVGIKQSADPDQNPKTPQAYQDDIAQLANDVATEPDQLDADRSNTDAPIKSAHGQHDSEIDLDFEPDIHNTQFISSPSPDEIDEQSISGSAPDPDSDDDTLQNAQMMGQQLEEDTENPEELDIARDIDKAEKFVHE